MCALERSGFPILENTKFTADMALHYLTELYETQKIPKIYHNMSNERM